MIRRLMFVAVFMCCLLVYAQAVAFTPSRNEASSPGGGGGGGTVTTVGTYGSADPSADDGALHICTDTPIVRSRESGTWVDYLPGFGAATVPTVAGVTAVNQGTSVWADAGGLRIGETVASATNRWRIATVPTIAAPYRVTAVISGPTSAANFLVTGAALYDSGTGRFVVIHRAGTVVKVERWTNTSTLASTLLSSSPINAGSEIALRIVDDGATRYYQTGTLSDGGTYWTTVMSTANTDHITAPDYAGFAFLSNNATQTAASKCLHLAVTSGGL